MPSGPVRRPSRGLQEAPPDASTLLAAADAMMAGQPAAPANETGDVPMTQITQTGPQQVAPQPRSLVAVLHRDLSAIGSTIQHAWPLMQHMAESQNVEGLVEAILEAENLGVAAEVFQMAMDGIRAASARQAAVLAQQGGQAPPAPGYGPSSVPPGGTQGIPVQ